MSRYRLPLLGLIALFSYENASANTALDQAHAMAQSPDPGWAYDNSGLRASVRGESQARSASGNYALASTPAGQAHAAMRARSIEDAKARDNEGGGFFGKLGGMFSGSSKWIWGGAAAGALLGLLFFSGFWPVLIGAAVGAGAGWLVSKFF